MPLHSYRSEALSDKKNGIINLKAFCAGDAVLIQVEMNMN
jgi:hypothetical protein